ncbi:MAG TPA: hypothetical protein VK870_15640 [Ignavibacteriaceae bacterium]|nr:hypothetical protein [Ignavibacteriaceae bacterium]
MKTKIIITALFVLTLLLTGCLTFNTISYEVHFDDYGDGTVKVLVNDIRSDAFNQKELDEDKNNLFEFLLKSDNFISQMKDEGKFITNRELKVEDGKLNGKVEYSFDEINNVEGIVYESPYYFLTVAPADSILSTNGQVMVSEDYKRIVWDNSIKVLKFKMFVSQTEGSSLTSMAQFYKEK